MYQTHLFEGKYMLVEVKLYLLVCDVDAQLFKRVFLEVFKSKDVQDSHIHATLSGTSKEEKGTNKIILLCYGTSKSPAGILIDKSLMIIQVQPKYRVCFGQPRSLVRNHKHQLSKSQSFINGFIFVWIDLTSSHFQYLHKQYLFLQHSVQTEHPAFHIQCSQLLLFMISHYPLNVEVTFSPCLVSGNKETAKMTGLPTGTPAFVHLCETTPWQSTLIFMKEFFWINEQPICSLSEVFLIIWTLFSPHATLYQKCMKVLLLVLWLPIDILLCMFASTSAVFHKGQQRFAETLRDHWS